MMLMAQVFCSLGIAAANGGIGALYLSIHKPVLAVIWGIAALGWVGTAWLQWRTAKILRRIKGGEG